MITIDPIEGKKLQMVAVTDEQGNQEVDINGKPLFVPDSAAIIRTNVNGKLYIALREIVRREGSARQSDNRVVLMYGTAEELSDMIMQDFITTAKLNIVTKQKTVQCVLRNQNAHIIHHDILESDYATMENTFRYSARQSSEGIPMVCGGEQIYRASYLDESGTRKDEIIEATNLSMIRDVKKDAAEEAERQAKLLAQEEALKAKVAEPALPGGE